MKKCTGRIFALLLALMLPLTALADVTLAGQSILPRMAFFSKASDTYYARTDAGYQLFDLEGNALGGAYGDIRTRQDGVYFEVYRESGLNKMGLMDQKGVEILPLEYGEFEYLSDKWVLAYVLEPTDADVGEFKDSSGNKYNIGRTDVVFEGKIIGSLTREDYIASYQASCKGDYLCIKMNSNACYWLNSSFERVDVRDDSYIAIAEFSDLSRKGIMHNPTQQYAFTEGCTLTADEVEQTLWYQADSKGRNGKLLDLQGNVIKDGLSYESIRYGGTEYVVTREKGMFGIMTAKGEEIVPPMYDDIPYEDGLFPNGYQAVLDEDGRLSYLDVNGQVTAKVDYKLSNDKYKGFYRNPNIVAVENMGQYIVITATNGELAEKYDDFSTARHGHQVISVKKGDSWGVIDMAGNTVVPFVHRSALEINVEGTAVMGVTHDREYVLYILDYGTEADAPVTDAPAAPQTPADGWTCPCGATNTGKFCTECGASKPVEKTPEADGSWNCAGCSTANTGKFCTECGMPKPAEEVKPVCAGCGYEPADGVAPKFCPECGAKF